MEKRILVVEDEPDIAAVLRMLLTAVGYVVLLACDLATARAALAAPPPPDLVILDIVLPDGNGLDLCRELKATRPSLPVLVLTARAQEQAEAAAAGADLVLTKPFELEALEAAVGQLAGDARGPTAP